MFKITARFILLLIVVTIIIGCKDKFPTNKPTQKVAANPDLSNIKALAVTSYPEKPGGPVRYSEAARFIKISRNLGFNCIDLLVTVYADANGEIIGRVPSDLASTIREVKRNGLRCGIRLYVDATDGSWRGGYMPPRNNNRFFERLEQIAMEVIEIGNQENIEYLIFGAEMQQLQDTQEFVDLFSKVSRRFDGQTIYAFDRVDFNKPSLSTSRLVEVLGEYIGITAWWGDSYFAQDLAEAKNLADSFGKRLFVAEFGSRSVKSTANNPALWESDEPPDAETQANSLELKFAAITEQNIPFVLWRYQANDYALDVDYDLRWNQMDFKRAACIVSQYLGGKTLYPKIWGDERFGKVWKFE